MNRRTINPPPAPPRRGAARFRSREGFAILIAAALNAFVAPCLVRAESKPGPKVEEATFQFEILGMHEPVEHTFYFENPGQEVLQMTNVTVAPPLDLVKATAKVSPGEQGSVTVRLGEPRRKGA